MSRERRWFRVRAPISAVVEMRVRAVSPEQACEKFHEYMEDGCEGDVLRAVDVTGEATAAEEPDHG